MNNGNNKHTVAPRSGRGRFGDKKLFDKIHKHQSLKSIVTR